MKNKLEIGKIVGTHGIAGDVKIYPWCDEIKEILEINSFFLSDGRELEFKERRVHKNVVLAKIEGICSPEAAKVYVGEVLLVERDEIKLEDGQFLIVDLIGLLVVDEKNEELVYGKIFDVIKTGANDVYHIRNSKGEQYLIPVIKSVVKSVDLANKKVKIAPMRGLFGDED